MNYTNEQSRIKQIRQKDSNGNYLTSIPLGADGFLIDMFSGLDLEEELKLGSNHYVEIKEVEDETIIREWYLTEPKGDTSIQTLPEEKINYSVEIRINLNTFNLELYKGSFPTQEPPEKEPLHSKIITIEEEKNGTEMNVNQELVTGEIEENSTADSAITDIDRIFQGGE